MGLRDRITGQKDMKVRVTYKLDGIPYSETYGSIPEAKSAMDELESNAKRRKEKISDFKYRLGTK